MKENTNKEKCANCTYPELLPKGKAGLKKKKRKEKRLKQWKRNLYCSVLSSSPNSLNSYPSSALSLTIMLSHCG